MPKRGSFGASKGQKVNGHVIPSNRAITAKQADKIVRAMILKGIRPDQAVKEFNDKAREGANMF